MDRSSWERGRPARTRPGTMEVIPANRGFRRFPLKVVSHTAGGQVFAGETPRVSPFRVRAEPRSGGSTWPVGVNPWIDLPGSAGVPPAQGLARWKRSLQTRIWCALQGSGPGWQVVCRYKVRARRPRSQGGTAPFRVYCVKDVPGFYPRIAPPSRRSRRSRAARRRQMRWGCKPGPRAPAQGSSRAA